jgi:hypothetical protein
MFKSILLSTVLLIGVQAISFSQVVEEEKKQDRNINLGLDEEGRFEVKIETRDSIPVSTRDTTIINTKNKTIYIVDNYDVNNFEDPEVMDSLLVDDGDSKSELTNWAGIDIGVNGFLNADGGMNLGDANDYLEIDYSKSRSISFNVIEYKARLIKDYVGITTGAGLQYNSYQFKNDYTLASINDTIVAFQDSTISISKNKLRTTWLRVPLLVEFNTSKYRDKSFHLAAGVVGGLHLGSMYKQKYSQDGGDYKVKTKNEFQVAPYKLEAMVRVGFGSLNLYGSYQLTELFENDHGPELYPFTLGLTIAAF